MKKRIKIFILAFPVFLAASLPSWAAVYGIDPVYSHIYFRIPHIVSKTAGMFARFDGTLDYDEKKKKIVSVNATIDISSLDTANARRDKDLRSERFFYTEKYPEATFVSTSVSSNKITGDLTLRGITKRVALNYKFGGIAKDQFGREKIGLSLDGKIVRKDFGITFNEKLDNGQYLLGEEVDLIIEVEAILQK